MKNSTYIRQAKLADIEALLSQFQAYLVFYKREPNLEKARRFLYTNLSEGRSIIFIALNENDKIVGFAQLYPHLSSLSMSSYFYLSDLYIDEANRRQGIATLLMKQVETYAIAAGALNVSLETADTNKTAQALYESLGYKWSPEFRTYTLKLPTSIAINK